MLRFNWIGYGQAVAIHWKSLITIQSHLAYNDNKMIFIKLYFGNKMKT